MGASFLMLIIAGVIGVIIGWLLRGPKPDMESAEQLEAAWRVKLEAKLRELDDLHALCSGHMARVAALEEQLAQSVAHLAGLEAMVHGRDRALQAVAERLKQV